MASLIVAETVESLRREIAALRRAGKRIAFVPTMGNLHEGHLRLVDEARRHAEAVVVSIYVNPLQFGPQEDFHAYPRTPAEDAALLAVRGVDLLFMPLDAEMYPRGLDAMTKVEVPGLSDILCGAFRPGHFRGVATVVNRLFNLVQPDVAVFGKKDYQQWVLIRRMVEDLGMPIEIIGVETVREPDGLAMSSRNRYLTPAERARAPELYRCLCEAVSALQAGGEAAQVEAWAASALTRAGFRPDYVSVRRAGDLAPSTPQDARRVILAAAWLGRARLIDNLEFGPS